MFDNLPTIKTMTLDVPLGGGNQRLYRQAKTPQKKSLKNNGRGEARKQQAKVAVISILAM